MNLYKNVPGKKSYTSRKFMGTKDVYNHAKKGSIGIKTQGWLYSKVQMSKKYFLWKLLRLDLIFTRFEPFFLGFFFLGYIFFRTLFPVILFPKNLTGSPHSNLGKKVPGIQNTGLYFQWHVFQGLEKIRTFSKIYFQVFFQKLFFPWTT